LEQNLCNSFCTLAETSSDAENAQAFEAAPTAAAVVILVNEGAKALRETNFDILLMRTSSVLA